MPGASIPPRVSVIIPTYDRAAYLGAAIASVRAQTFTDWELIVVDDGSTDHTAAILDELADPHLQVRRISHSGSESITRNAGIRAAKGEWVAFLDSDDLWVPEKLERQLAVMAAHPACQWSYTGIAYLDASGVPSSRPPLPGKALPRERRLEALLRFEVGAPIPTVIVHRSLLDSVDWLDETLPLRADYDLIVRLAECADAAALPDCLTLVREHAGRTTSQRRPAELFQLNERVFRKLAVTSRRAEVRALCRRQAARQCASAALALSREGAHHQALQSVGRGLRDAPLALDVWRALIGCMIGLARPGKR
jgi:glycosyltransferase involved in cell wall biosynthesis